MKGYHLGLIWTSLAAILLLGAGFLLYGSGPQYCGIAFSCISSSQLLWFGVLLILGAGFLGFVCMLITAGDIRDWSGRDVLSLFLMILLYLLSYGPTAYALALVNQTDVAGPAFALWSYRAVTPFLVITSFVAVPLTTLIYALALRERLWARRIVLAGMVALTVLLPIVLAPPWIIFG
jgi:hypothetical protein